MQFVVCYAKIAEDKDDGYYLAGVYFGGIGDNKESADKIARDCVNTIKGGTIIPHLAQLTGKHQLPSIMQAALEKFRQMESRFIEVEDIMENTAKRR